MVALSASVGTARWPLSGTVSASPVARADSTPSSGYDVWHVLSGPLNDEWTLRQPEPARVFFESVEYVAVFGPVPILAYGPTVEAALADLRSEIVDHFLWLERERLLLVPRLEAERRQLETMLRPIAVG